MAETHDGVQAIASIPADDIRDALLRTMVLGLPPTEADRPTFHWEREVTWADFDSEDEPWDWTSAPDSETQKAPVKPICAVEFFSPLGRQGATFTEVGDFTPTTIVFTMFEDAFTQVEDFSYATVGPGATKWYFRFWRPSLGLGSLQVYQVHCVAEGID